MLALIKSIIGIADGVINIALAAYGVALIVGLIDTVPPGFSVGEMAVLCVVLAHNRSRRAREGQ